MVTIMTKGFIFDMDGTLIDSMGIICELDRKILAELGLSHRTDLLDAMRYLPLGDSAAYVVDHSDVPYTAEELSKIMIDNTIKGYEAVQVKEGVFDLLDACRKSGIRMAIATATEPDIAAEVAGRLGLLSYMETLVSCTDVGKTKEHPDVFLKAAENMWLTPEECAVFEDGLPGAKSAKSAGFTVVGVYDKSSAGDEDAMREVCDRYVTEFSELGDAELG